MFDLSRGALEVMQRGEVPQIVQPILQILFIKKLQSYNGVRYKVSATDGITESSNILLVSRLNSMVENNELLNCAIVKIKEYILVPLNRPNNNSHQVINVLDLEVMVKGRSPGPDDDMITLTSGALATLATNPHRNYWVPIVQVLRFSLEGSGSRAMYRLCLSDGTNQTRHCYLSPKLTHMVEKKLLVRYSIIAIVAYTVGEKNHANLPLYNDPLRRNNKLLALFSYRLLVNGAQVGRKIDDKQQFHVVSISTACGVERLLEEVER